MLKSFVDVCCGFVWHSEAFGLIWSHSELKRLNFKMSQKVGDRPPPPPPPFLTTAIVDHMGTFSNIRNKLTLEKSDLHSKIGKDSTCHWDSSVNKKTLDSQLRDSDGGKTGENIISVFTSNNNFSTSWCCLSIRISILRRISVLDLASTALGM